LFYVKSRRADVTFADFSQPISLSLKKHLLLFLFCALASWAGAQNVLVGIVTDRNTGTPVQDAAVAIEGTAFFAATDASGRFTIERVPPGKYTVTASHAGYEVTQIEVNIQPSRRGDAFIELTLQPDAVVPTSAPTNVTPTGDIPTVTLEEAESETDGAAEVANMLHASRDVFQNVSSFGWSTFRFRERGYNSDQFQVYLNGIPFNDPESGAAFFGEFGGLNDVLRNRTSTIGLDPAEFAFSEIGGATMIDLRASNQRKQIRASYAVSNRLYRNRAMVTLNTGLMPGGWAVSASGSARWAEEGYIAGTPFEGYSYFLSVDKKIGKHHSLNAVVFGAPTTRGRAADSFEEMYQIAGTNYYNPLWGYQNGKKRNSQIASNHQPTGILRYDWKPSYKTSATVATYVQAGVTGFTRLNWLGGNNPAPDFNRRLPSSYPDSVSAANWGAALAGDENLRQLDWDAMYNANRRTPSTILNAEGEVGNTVTGNRSVYILENQKTRNQEAGINAYINHSLTDEINVNGGGYYQYYKGGNYKVVEDLLGGEFWTDFDFFSQFGNQTGNPAGNSDLLNPNNLVGEGDVFGYNYDENIRRGLVWGQGQWSLPRFQFFAAGEFVNTSMWRTGYMQNGRFPDNSLGDSDKVNFNTYNVKGGVTFKANGRNYLYANGLIGTRAPLYRNVFVSPRTRDQVLPGIKPANITSIEGGYIHRAPKFRMRLTGYITNYTNETESAFANAQTTSRVLQNIDFSALDLEDEAETFLQSPIFFGSAIMTGVARRHAGMELGVEYKPIPGVTLTGALASGRNVYTSRPDLYLSLDNSDAAFFNLGQVYQNNMYVARTPQTAGALSVRYEGARFWFLSVTGNYASQMWYDFDRLRRTAAFTDAIDPNSAIYQTITNQTQAPDAFTLDLFGGKSWRIKEDYFIYLNVGVNNVLNNQNIVISGRESYRNAFRRDVSDPRFYTSEVIYAFGLNYFVQVAIRI
jgi:Carboxypeptidase regulatory-like domain